jgi:hypothetical protein
MEVFSLTRVSRWIPEQIVRQSFGAERCGALDGNNVITIPTAVPKPGTLISGALLLLPFGARPCSAFCAANPHHSRASRQFHIHHYRTGRSKTGLFFLRGFVGGDPKEGLPGRRPSSAAKNLPRAAATDFSLGFSSQKL